MPENMPAAIYCRISRDRDGEGLGVDRQEADCRALAGRLGFEVVAVYIDNDISASTKSRKPRPQYDEMMRRARRREFGAILAYSNSRLTRRSREFEDLIDLHATTGMLIKTVVSGDDDLSVADGRMVARIKANVDTAEAERTSERVARAKKQAVESGKYRGGPRPFGYNKGGMTVREKEAEVIRHATKAILAGRSLMGVTRELNKTGSKTSTGRSWSHDRLKDVLVRPRNAGLVNTGRPDHFNVEIIGKANWPAIVDEEEFHAVSRILLDPSRRRSTTSAPKWLGSGIYTCGRCRGIMRSFSVPRAGKRIPAYRCIDNDHLMIVAPKTDDYVRGVVAERVRDPRVVEAMTAGENDVMATDRERRSLLGTRLEQTESDYDDDLIDARRYKTKVEKITAELEQIEERLVTGVQQATVSPIFAQVDPGAAFLGAPIDVQRAVLRSVLRVEVHPQPRRGSAWSSDRLLITPVT